MREGNPAQLSHALSSTLSSVGLSLPGSRSLTVTVRSYGDRALAI